PDGKILAAGDARDPMVVWVWDVSNPDTPVELVHLSGHSYYVSSVAFSPNGKLLASGSLDGTIILWDLSDLSAPAKLATISESESNVYSLAFRPDGRILASGSGFNAILWDVSNPKAPIKLTNLCG